MTVFQKIGCDVAGLRKIIWFMLVGVLVILFQLWQTRPVYAQDAPGFETVDCSTFELPAALTQARQVKCGMVTVPEQYSDPQGPTIQLGVAILKSTSEHVSPFPLFMMQGGPGGSTLHDFPLFLMLNKRLLTSDHDIVLFDQRGTMYAKPRLDCPEEMELTLQTLNQDLSDEESLRLSEEALQKCRSRLQKEGINLSAYDSLENAADVDSIRKALGYEKIDLYGVSYGTLLALQVMRLYPDGLRTVVLDSVVAPQINDMLDGVQPQVRSIKMVFDACAADADCRAAYPDLEKVFYEQVDRLNKEPVEIQLTDTDSTKTYPALLDGDAVIYTAIMMMFSTETIPMVPRMIYDARAGNYLLIEQILSSVTFDRSYSWGMFYSVKCAEEANYTSDQVNDAGIPAEFVPLSKNTTESFLQTCRLWSVEDESAKADVAVTSDIPTLILSGAFDPTTPPHYAEEVKKTLSNSYAFMFPSGGHGELFSFDCAVSIMFDFLNDPATQPDGSCIPAGNPEFVTAKSVVRLPAILKFLSLQGTAGIELALFAVVLFFLLTAWLVYPVVWLYRLLRGKPAPSALPVQPEMGYPAQTPARSNRPGSWKLAPWLAVLTGLSLLIFTVLLVVVLFGMVAANDVRYLIGVPGSARLLFILPLAAAFLTLGMLGLGLLAWLRGWGSVWGRLYFSFISLAALGCVVILAYWGMVTALFSA